MMMMAILQVRKLRRDLIIAQEKVQTLTNQLSTNVSNVPCCYVELCPLVLFFNFSSVVFILFAAVLVSCLSL